MARAGRRSVVITGASSGIGRASAERLAEAGFQVFATVRRAADGEELRREVSGVVPVEMDVVDPASIAAAAAYVRAQLNGHGLDGLVNNAGVGTTGPMEHTDLPALRHQLEVNVVGPLAVTQAFLPLIRQARGRIVNMGSVGGRFTVPFGGVLCASKSALGAMTDALRLELHPFGIHVSLIEPASIDTPAVDKTLGDVEAAVRAIPPAGRRFYEPMLREFNRRAYRREKHGSPPDVVARVVEAALTAPRPRARYLAGKGARVMMALRRLLPERRLDAVRLRLFGMPRVFGSLAAT